MELIWKIKDGAEEGVGVGLGLRTGARTNTNPTHITLLLPDANLVAIVLTRPQSST